MADPYSIADGEERWRARWRTGSGERDSKSGFLTEGDAVAHEEKMRTARRDGKPVRQPRTRMTVDDLWDRFWEEEVVVAKSRGTQYGYRDTYRAYIGPHIGGLKIRALIEDPQPLKRWRSVLARTKSKAVVDHASAVASSMFSFAAEEDLIPFNPLLALAQQGRNRGRKRKVAREQVQQDPVAVDPTAWFLVMEYLRLPTRPAARAGRKPRNRRYPLDRERDALIVAIGFMGGFRLPSEALALAKEDVKPARLHMEGHSSSGEYVPGSKTGPRRDLILLELLAAEFRRVEGIYSDAGIALAPTDFWIPARDGAMWTEHQADNWRERDFHPVARQVAIDYPQFSDLAAATPYWTRHTFISSCLQAGISLPTIAAWCGTSIQMISDTYGRMIRRYEGLPPVDLEEQFQTAKVEAMSLLSATRKKPVLAKGGSTGGSTPPFRRRSRPSEKLLVAGISPT